MIKKIKLIKISIDIDRIETEETPTSWEKAFRGVEETHIFWDGELIGKVDKSLDCREDICKEILRIDESE